MKYLTVFKITLFLVVLLIPRFSFADQIISCPEELKPINDIGPSGNQKSKIEDTKFKLKKKFLRDPTIYKRINGQWINYEEVFISNHPTLCLKKWINKKVGKTKILDNGCKTTKTSIICETKFKCIEVLADVLTDDKPNNTEEFRLGLKTVKGLNWEQPYWVGMAENQYEKRCKASSKFMCKALPEPKRGDGLAFVSKMFWCNMAEGMCNLENNRENMRLIMKQQDEDFFKERTNSILIDFEFLEISQFYDGKKINEESCSKFSNN